MIRRVVFALLLVSLIWAWLDFVQFCEKAAAAAPPEDPRGDAVIVLTGGSGLRIASGVQLVEAGAAPTLLISGVHPDVTMEEMATLGGGQADTYACCVELGYAAETTLGNATETAGWAAGHNYKDLIIVTSDYHMPRSLILLRAAMPDLVLTPYPVRTRINPERPFGDLRSFRGLIWEWAKWRVTRLEAGGAGA